MNRTSLLPEGLSLDGSIEGRGDLVIAGTVEGPVDLEGELTIEATGRVEGPVHVTALVVRGTLVGACQAKESIQVDASATVVGDAKAPRVRIADGARYRGRVQITGDASAAGLGADRRRRGSRRRLAAARTGDDSAGREAEPGKDAGGPGPDRVRDDAEPPRARRGREPSRVRRSAPKTGEAPRSPGARAERNERLPASRNMFSEEKTERLLPPSPSPALEREGTSGPAPASQRRSRKAPSPVMPAIGRQRARRTDNRSS